MTVGRPPAFTDIRPGASVALNGCCLTVFACTADTLEFDLTEETLQKTTLGSLRPAMRVNLERAVRADSRLDGHVVQGHVETTGEVVAIAGENLEVRIQKQFLNNVFPKGSIAIDGVSLTVADIRGDVLCFAIVPFTASHTVMAGYAPGTRVNVETDILTRKAAAS